MEGSSIIWQNIVDWIGGANLMGSKVLNSLIGDETCRDSAGKKLRGRDGCAAMCLPAFCSLSYLPCAYLDTEPLISLHQSHHPRGHQHWVHRLQVDYSEHGNFYY
ncbi:unnamed protein product [Sphagnum jensenii]